MIKLALIGLAAVSLIELTIWTHDLWRWRKALCCVVIIGLSVFSGLLIGTSFSLWSLLVLYFGVYRVVNLLRVIEGRTQADYLYRVAMRSSWLLILFQLILGAAYYITSIGSHKPAWLYVLAAVQAIAILTLVITSLRSFSKTLPSRYVQHFKDSDLPALSVVIPARNETEDLSQCLESLIASTYPKLEIVVLDDCSQNKHTPKIIQGFAHAGVKFISGQAPPKNWTAKNYAYSQLAHQSNGELLLFCGVDTRFEPDTLKLMVDNFIKRKKAMMSILPVNKLPSLTSLRSLLIQPSRYVWELAIPRRLLKRPPVLSTCWLIKADFLASCGGFEAVAGSIAPESYFARRAVMSSDSYSFLQSSDYFGLTSVKSGLEQQATAIRTRYPQLHRRPELVALLTLVEFLILGGPVIMFIYALIKDNAFLISISAVNLLALVVLYFVYVHLTYQKYLIRGLLLKPLASLFDLVLLNYSMYLYEFKEVLWKGRNVCIPVMKVFPMRKELP